MRDKLGADGCSLLFLPAPLSNHVPSSNHSFSFLSPLSPHLATTHSLIFEGFGSKLGKRVQDALKFCFPVPK